MSKIRINDLARELEVKSKAILDVLGEVGVTEKKTHSSSVEDHEAEKVRAHFRKTSEAQTQSKASRSTRAEADEIKTKIDLSHISKPGDVLNLLRKQQAPAAPLAPPAPPARPVVVPPPVETKPAAVPPVAKAPLPAAPKPPMAPPPRLVLPVQPTRPVVAAPAPASGSDDHSAASGSVSRFCAAGPGRPASGSVLGDSAAAAGPDGGETRGSVPAATTLAAHDRATNRAPPGVHGASPQAILGSLSQFSAAACSGAPRARAADFSAPAAGCSDGAPCGASGRAPAHASDSAVPDGHAASRRRSGCAAARLDPSRNPSRRTIASAGPTLYSAWGEGRPHEGLYAAPAPFLVE